MREIKNLFKMISYIFNDLSTITNDKSKNKDSLKPLEKETEDGDEEDDKSKD